MARYGPLVVAAAYVCLAPLAIGQSIPPQAPPGGSAASQTPSRTAPDQEMRANILLARKNYAEAVPILQSLIDQEKDKVRKAALYNKLGIAFQQQGSYDQAKRSYDRALKLDPRNASAINNLGTIHYQRKKYRKAIQTYKKALVVDPNLASVRSNLAYAYFGDKQYELALEEVRRAVELDPNIFDRGSAVGTVLQDRTVTDRGLFYFLMAKSFAGIGNAERCAQYLRKARDEGYAQWASAAADPAFVGVREDPQVREVLDLAAPPTTTQPKPPGA